MTTGRLYAVLRKEHGLIVGERMLERLSGESARSGMGRIKVSGRSVRTGRKKTVSVAISRL